ncbi:hypothetical protein D3C84_501590 [compost metagenome]
MVWFGIPTAQSNLPERRENQPDAKQDKYVCNAHEQPSEIGSQPVSDGTEQRFYFILERQRQNDEQQDGGS